MEARTTIQVRLGGARMRVAEGPMSGMLYPSPHLRSVSSESGNDNLRLGVWERFGQTRNNGVLRSWWYQSLLILSSPLAWAMGLHTQRRLGPHLAALAALLYHYWPGYALSGPCLQVHSMGEALKPWLVPPLQTLKY